MPATFAHPVFAIPFARWKLPLSALIYGSVAPDVAHVIPFHLPHAFRHNLQGVFCFALPVGLIMLWLHHEVIKRPAASMLPARFQARLAPKLEPFSFGPPSRFARICLAVIIGALTHLAVDECTHLYGWPVRNLDFLRAVVWELPHEKLRVYRMMQYVLSVIGTGVLIYWGRGYLRDLIPTAADRHRVLRALAMIAIAAIVAVIYAAFAAVDEDGYRAVRVFVVRFLFGSMAAFFATLLLYGARFRFR